MTESDKLIAINALSLQSLKKAIYQMCEVSQDDTTAIFSTFDDVVDVDDDDDDKSETIEDNDDNDNSLTALKTSGPLRVGDLIQYRQQNTYNVGIVVCWCKLPDYAFVVDITNRHTTSPIFTLVKIQTDDIMNNPRLSYDNPTDNKSARRLIYQLRKYCYKRDFINTTDDYVTHIINGRFTNDRIKEIMTTFGFKTIRGGQWTNAVVSFYYHDELKKLGGE